MGKKKDKQEDNKRKDDRAKKQECKKERKKAQSNEWRKTWKEFAQQLHGLGLRLRNTAPDGNCLFRSFADQLAGDEDKHMEYRQKVCDFMLKHPDDYAPFLETDFETYVHQMRKDGKWGGNVEIAAASKAFSTHIIIHQLNAPRLEVRNPDPRARYIHLAYHDQEHYSSVRLAKDDTSDVAVSVEIKKLDGEKNAKALGEDHPDFDKMTRKEKIIMQSTGCRNLPLIREALKDFWDDLDATTEYILALQTSKTEDDEKQLEDYPDDIPSEPVLQAPAQVGKAKAPQEQPVAKAPEKKEKEVVKSVVVVPAGAPQREAPVEEPPAPKKGGKKPVRIQKLSNKERKELQKKQKQHEQRQAAEEAARARVSADEELVRDVGSLCI